ncbi:MAG: GNAT family N-acetyltransferase [Vampirovibrio sp.]|nr:GNAT family N-acetyltransferase [Vampirovibrio sp.]
MLGLTEGPIIFEPIIQDRNQELSVESADLLGKLLVQHQASLFDDFYFLPSDDPAQQVLKTVKTRHPYFWLVRFNHQPAGFLYLDNWYGRADKPYSCDAHIMFDRVFWGNPKIEVACHLLIDYLFEQMGLFRITCWVATKNVPAVRLLQRLGFVREGKARGRVMVKGQPQSEYLYGMIRPDYFNRANALQKAT